MSLHGAQEQRQFHAYYDHHCYLPLYVFCGQAMLACHLRPSQIDGARHAAAIVELPVQRLRRCWPRTRIIVRADSGFCRPNLIRWCERAGVGYVIGLARNRRLEATVSMVEMAMREACERTGVKQRELGEFRYAAASWDRERRVIARLEYGAQGVNPRFVVTNLAPIECAAIANDGHNSLAMLQRRPGETLAQLLGRLDLAVAPAYAEDVFTDEISVPSRRR